MVVSTDPDNSIEMQWQCEKYSLSMSGQVFEIDLIYLPHKSIDVILGMD